MKPLQSLMDRDRKPAARCHDALPATFEARDTHPLPVRLPAPPADWEEPYAALAEDLGLPARTPSQAYVYLDVHWRRWTQAKQEPQQGKTPHARIPRPDSGCCRL